MGLSPKDKDYVVVGATPTQMINQGFKKVGKHFPVFIHPETNEEYALARLEKKIGMGHDGFSFDFSPSITLEQDLLRRDITINAMAMDGDRLIDPYGGKKDMEQKIIKHVSDHFREDPLRVLRVARFAAKMPDFHIARETLDLMREISKSSELNFLSGERIYLEMAKAMETKNPEIFFQTLDECHALEILFPELYNLKGVPQNPQYHPEGDAWVHTLLVLKHACKFSHSLEVKFAALLHDVGKALTPKDLLPGHPGHEEAGLPVIKRFGEKYKFPRETLNLCLKFCKYHLLCHKIFSLRPATILDLLMGIDAFRKKKLLENFLICAQADHAGKLNQQYPQAYYLMNIVRVLKSVDIRQAMINKDNIGDNIRNIRINAIKKFSREF